jgi:hypothetical protein
MTKTEFKQGLLKRLQFQSHSDYWEVSSPLISGHWNSMLTLDVDEAEKKVWNTKNDSLLFNGYSLCKRN